MKLGDRYRKRRKICDQPGHAHYLTFSCFHNQPFLASERACGWLIDAIQTARVKHPFDLWAWVFMPDHVHMLIRPHDGVYIRHVLSAIKTPVGKRAAGWARREAPKLLAVMLDVQPNGRRTARLWQRGGGYDRNIWSPAELREKIRYIHDNPVRRGLAETGEDWRWSSWRAWQAGVDDPVPIDRDTLPALDG